MAEYQYPVPFTIPDPDYSDDQLEPAPKKEWPPKLPTKLEKFAIAYFDKFEAQIEKNHACLYFSCCFNFSTKAMAQKTKHTVSGMTWRQFRKQIQPLNAEGFAAVLDSIARELPNSWKRCPTWNTPHTDLLAELKAEEADPFRDSQLQLKENEIRDLKYDKAIMNNDIQRLTLRAQNQEVELNRLRYFLKAQGIDPQALLRGQTPSNNEMLKKHAPENLEWPDYLPSYPTPNPYHPAFPKVKELINQKGRNSKPDVARLMSEEDAEELDRMVQAGLPHPLVRSVPEMEMLRPPTPAFWTEGLAEPPSKTFAKKKLKNNPAN